ncbi:MAG: zinc ribbon domain-containing protein [Solobacterium sp.]|nr:zinc ribbon domain-containing protein [Solobacterium sp.]
MNDNMARIRAKIRNDVALSGASWGFLLAVLLLVQAIRKKGNLYFMAGCFLTVVVISFLVYLWRTAAVKKQIPRKDMDSFAHDHLEKAGPGFYLGEEWLVFEDRETYRILRKADLSDIREYCTHAENVKGLIEVFLNGKARPERFVFDRKNHADLPGNLRSWLIPDLEADMAVCPFCGNVQAADLVFCENCGARLKAEAPVKTAAPAVRSIPAAPSVQPKRDRKSLFLLGLAVTAILAVFWQLLM